VKPYVYPAAVRALNETIQRRNLNAWVDTTPSKYCLCLLRYKPTSLATISILIPTKDKPDLLKKCIDSVLATTQYPHIEFIVVSNNSSEAAFFTLLNEFQQTLGNRFSFFEWNHPFNFSELINQAAKRARGEYLLLLNNDVEAIEEGWLEEMLGMAEQPHIGAVGAQLLYFDQTIQHGGVVVGVGEIASHAFVRANPKQLLYFGQPLSVDNYSAVTAACLMCRKERFWEVGGFNEELKIEFNDVDFCLKLKERGYHHVWLPYVKLYHHESVSRGNFSATSEKLAQHITEAEIIKNLWQPYLDYDPCYNINLSRWVPYHPERVIYSPQGINPHSK
jgi:GT2 family glycosyltransferase